MIAELGNQNMRQSAGPANAALDGPRRRWSFDYALAGRASELGPHMANHLEALWHVLQLLAHILAEVLSAPPQSGQQSCAGVCVTSSRRRCSGSGLRRGRAPALLQGEQHRHRFRRCLRGLQLFQFQFELLQLNDDLLALLAE